MRVYITFSPYGDRPIYYVGTDKQAALDAKQITDDICQMRDLTVTREGSDFVPVLAWPAEVPRSFTA